MPIQIVAESEVELNDQELESLLGTDESPTVEAQILGDFLEDTDFAEVMDTPEVQEFIEEEKEGEGDDAVDVEWLPGEVIAEALDYDDLYASFVYHVNHLMPAETMEDKTRHAVALSMLDEADVLDEYKKGDFSKLARKGVGGRGLVNRMLGAMVKKGAIRHTKSGEKGYKAPGAEGPASYQKAGTYRKGGTSAGKRKVAQFRKSKKSQLATQARKTVGARTTVRGKTKRITAASISAKIKDIGKVKGKKPAKPQAGVSKSGKKLNASIEGGERSSLDEGVRLTSAMLRAMPRSCASALVEAK